MKPILIKLALLGFHYPAFFLALILTTMLVGCENKLSSEPESLPTDAIHVVDKGNGWVYFELDDVKYLYHRSDIGGSTHQAITVVNPRCCYACSEPPPKEEERDLWNES